MNDVSRDQLADNLMRRVNVGDLLARSARRFAGHAALVDGARQLSYGQLDAWVNRTAHGLLDRGFRRGDALTLMAENSAEFLVVFFACARTGVVCVPINLLWGQREIEHVIGHSRARGLVVERGCFDQAKAAVAQADGLEEIIFIGEAPSAVAGKRTTTLEDLAAGKPETLPPCLVMNEDAVSYLYTSGTTSAPKGVINTHLATYLEALGAIIDLAISSRDRMLAVLPMFHTAQLYAACIPALAAGATVHIMKGFELEPVLDAVASEGITVIFALPMMYRAMLAEQDRRPRNVSSLRLALYAMAPMTGDEIRRVADSFGCDLSLLFGQTEMNPISAVLRPEHQLSHGGAVGTSSINVEIGVIDAQGAPLPSGEVGEIVYRSPQVLAGYLRDPQATAEVCRDGWFHSGDAGFIDEDGVLWFTDRIKDVIKSGGENVSSLEVERAIYDHEADVIEVAVIGLPHDHWVEAVTAVVVARPGSRLDGEAMIVRLRQRLSRFKCPKGLIIVDELPKTATGKIQKHALRARFLQHYQSDNGLAAP